MDGPLDWLDEDMNIDEVESQPDTKPLGNNETVVIEKENVAQLEIQGANMLKKDTPQIRFLFIPIHLEIFLHCFSCF